MSGEEDTEADDDEVVGLEDTVIHTPVPYNHRELTGNQRASVLNSLLEHKTDYHLQHGAINGVVQKHDIS